MSVKQPSPPVSRCRCVAPSVTHESELLVTTISPSNFVAAVESVEFGLDDDMSMDFIPLCVDRLNDYHKTLRRE